MFWNLVRYEFKNVNKWYLALYGAVLALSALIGVQASSLKSIDTPDQQMIMLVFLALVFGGLIITLSISTLILIIRRFKGSVYDRQGYLTLTLPVSEHQIILSKLLGAFIWSLASSLVFILSIYIILVLTGANFLDIFSLEYLFKFYMDSFWLSVISFILSTVASILCIYLSISIGQLFNEYRTALAVLAYIVIHIVLGFVDMFSPSLNYSMMMSAEIFKDLILSAAFYLGTYYILKNKVNLQ
ncbi:ABC transporter permease [Streptococcus sp. SK140]|uniref:ABC transporter permease n=1 Tax=Streptococcus sp. SK140 TaxID=1095726 RepID=UPI00025B2E46|nr:ABC transporter permease [Streptococcus sp. SK140]EIF37614.1 ABC-2 family transporter protein [Streptococcus sp. SK140]